MGSPSTLLEEAIAKVLEAQTIQILEEAKACMEKEITLEELFGVASTMAKNKIPSKDGLPVEFFLALWEELGPILLKVLKHGL